MRPGVTPVLNHQSFKLATTVLFLVAASFAGVNVSSPTNGSTVGTSVHIVANATSAYPIVAMKVYVDNNIAYSVATGSIDTYLGMATGTRSIAIQAWDSTGAVQKNALSVTVGSTTTTAVTSSTGVVITAPTNGSGVGSPATISAAGGSSITKMQVYMDGSLAYTASGNAVNTQLSLASGTHYMQVQGWDNYGNYYKSAPISFSVTGTTTTTSSSTTSTTTSSAPKYSDIQAMSGWASCGSCAGAGGNGPSVPYSVTQWLSNPSLDGKAAQFWIGGTTPYAQALWWKQLGGNSNASNFVYDLYFYVKDPNAPQALEFDVNQSVNGLKYIFGTECNVRETGTWRIWDTKNAKWVNSGIGCPKPAAYTWNHLTWEFKRVGSQTEFVAVTLNGAKSYVNRYFYAQPSGVSEINVAFQVDQNFYPTNYSVWLDKVSLNYW